jgi:lysozyme
MTRLHEMLIRHEGLRLKPYRDTVGKLTIGIGRNLDDVGITREEAMMLLNHDIAKVQREVQNAFPWFSDLNRVRKNVVLNMVFNLGLPRYRQFKKAIAAIRAKRWDEAAKQMLDSRWARQVGRRARELASMMKSGKYNLTLRVT